MRVVLDTNILISALIVSEGIPNYLYQSWRVGRYSLVSGGISSRQNGMAACASLVPIGVQSFSAIWLGFDVAVVAFSNFPDGTSDTRETGATSFRHLT